MGHEYQGTCYASEPQALDAYFGVHAPVVFEDAAGISLYQYALVSGNWIFQKSLISLAGTETIQYQMQPAYPTFSACDALNDKTAQFTEGMLLGSAVAVTMVLCWCIRAIRPYR
jgi:hypothetical protein